MQIPNPLDDYADNSPSLALETDKYIMCPISYSGGHRIDSGGLYEL